MTYQEFKQATQMVAQGNSVFIDNNIHSTGLETISFSIVYDDPENGDENGNGCLRTKAHHGEHRYQDCLMDMKLQIFNLQKQPANTNAWRDEVAA